MSMALARKTAPKKDQLPYARTRGPSEPRAVKPADLQGKDLQVVIGKRLLSRRNEVDLSQERFCARMIPHGLDVTHGLVSGWENGKHPMSLIQIVIASKVLDLRPEYLAFGLTGEPEKVWPSYEELGFVPVAEFEFGPDRRKTEIRKWGLPTDWLRNELKITGDLDAVVIHKVGGDADGYEFGDRVIVDCSESSRNLGVPGKFLYYWDNNGPVVGQLLAIPSANAKKKTVRMTGATGTHELEADRIYVVGRVRGLWRQS